MVKGKVGSVLLFYLFTFLPLSVQAQRVSFTIQDGLYNQQLKSSMESSISSLLTEINAACSENRALRLSGFSMADKARKQLESLWNNYAHFSCDFESNVSKCLSTVNGYEVREIYVTLHPIDESQFKGERSREFAIGFAKDRTITSARLAMENNSYQAVLNKGGDVTDVRRRMEILSFVEDFRSYYDEKDINALEQIYSDDALIITGKVVMKKDMGDRQARLRPEIKYNKQTKTEYIQHLRRIFANNRYIKVKFDDISVMAHPAKNNFYGVTLRQNWKSSSYEDDGYVFLLWEFPDENDPRGSHPLVHVRTWQPEKYGNQVTTADEVFTSNDFFIP